jgi:hypothetical protein
VLLGVLLEVNVTVGGTLYLQSALIVVAFAIVTVVDALTVLAIVLLPLTLVHLLKL